jgi:hypothetical protein
LVVAIIYLKVLIIRFITCVPRTSKNTLLKVKLKVKGTS